MKKIFSLMIVLPVLLASCASRVQPTEDPTVSTDIPNSLDTLLVDRLSVNLGLDPGEITVKSEIGKEFSDLCLEVSLLGTACGQVLTPGWIFILEANGIEYEYRTDVAGDTIQPASLALTWTREGGFAGFCDWLTVYLSGEVYGSNCRSDPNETSSSFAELLSTAQHDQFNAWFLKYGEIRLDVSDPAGVADRMVNTLVFYGSGTGRPGKADQQALFDWTNAVFQKLYS